MIYTGVSFFGIIYPIYSENTTPF